jgi:hypothetical protein
MDFILNILKNRSYALKYVFFTDGYGEHTATLFNGSIIFECGSNVGMLSIELMCNCCSNMYSTRYFFEMNATDSTMVCMRPELDETHKRLYINLPCGSRGVFEFEAYLTQATSSKSWGWDNYIVKKFVETNYVPEVNYYFNSILQKHCKLHTAFVMIKRFAYRDRMRSHRTAALHSLSTRGIDEVSIRARIIKLAHLW